MSAKYTLERHERGLIVRGPIPLGDFGGIVALGKSIGFNLVDHGLSGALEATLVLVSRRTGPGWRKEVEENAARRAHGNAELAWLWGTDTGLSAITILSVLGTSSETRIWAMDRVGASRLGATPMDPDDFGRCHRLLERCPSFRARLGEVAEKFSAWRGLVAAWPELTALYLAELPRGRAPRLAARMAEIAKAEGR